MSIVKRYTFDGDSMEEDPYGEFMKWEDFVQAMAGLMGVKVEDLVKKPDPEPEDDEDDWDGCAGC